MSKRFALIKNGCVKNVVVADVDFISKISHQYDKCIELDVLDNVQPKDEYNDDLKIFSRAFEETYKCDVEGCTTFQGIEAHATSEEKTLIESVKIVAGYVAASAIGGGAVYALQNFIGDK